MWKLFAGKKPSLDERIDAFWQWFQKNEQLLLSHSAQQEKAFSALSKELDKVHKATFEFGPVVDGKQEFFISADGILADIPRVVSILRRKPDLPKWDIKPFRQRKETTTVMQTGDISIGEEQCFFQHGAVENGHIDVTMYMKGFSEEMYNFFGLAGFLFLDGALGEFCVATQVGAVEFKPLTNEIMSDSKTMPLNKLAGVFDELMPTNMTYSLNGNWSGNYKYAVEDNPKADKEFKCNAALQSSGPYLSGTISDESQKTAQVIGYVHGPVIVFEKSYEGTGDEPVIYQGRISADGKSMSGTWQLDRGNMRITGPWELRCV